MGQPAVNQIHFNSYADNPGETDADAQSTLGTEDTRYTSFSPGDLVHVRLKVRNVDKNYGTYTPALRFRINGGSWSTPPTITSYLSIVSVSTDGAPSPDGQDISELLSAATTPYSFAGGSYTESSASQSADTLSINEEWEYQWCLLVHPRNVSATDTIDFILTDNGTLPDNAATAPVGVFQIRSDFELISVCEMHDWRWYSTSSNTDPDNVSGNEKAAESTSYEVQTSELDTELNLRIAMAMPHSSGANETAQLQYNVDGAGWNNVNTTSSYVRNYGSSGITDNQVNETQLLSTTGHVFLSAGYFDKNSGSVIFATSITSPSFSTEVQFAIQFRSADLSGGETIQFRLVDASTNTEIALLGSGHSLPQVTIQAASADHTVTFTGDPPEGDGELDLTGKTPTVHWSVTSAAEELDLTGKVPALNLAIESGREELDLTGKAPSIKIAYVIIPGREELALTGKAPTLKLAVVAEPTEGDVTLTGKVPRLAIGIAVGEGTLTVTGKAPAVILSEFVSPDIEVLEIIEKTPVTIVNFIRGPPEETLSLEGKAPIVFRQDYISPGREQLDLSGKVPLRTIAGAVPEGSLFLTGKPLPFINTDVHHNITVPYLQLRLKTSTGLGLYGHPPTVDTGLTPVQRLVDEGSLALTGKAPSLGLALVLTAEELDLVGKAPSVHWTITSARYELALTGKAPTVFRQDSIAPTEGDLTLTGKEPSPEQTFVRTVTEGDLTLTGKAPTIVAQDEITPVEGDLALTGKEPSPEQTFVREVTEGDLTLTGEAPSVEQTFIRAVTEGDLTLVGKVPEAVREDAEVPPEGTITLAGKAPAANETHYRDPARVELSLASEAPTVRVTLLAQPAKAELTIAGKAPTLFRQDYLQPARVQLSLAGYAPSTGQALVEEPAEVTLALTGKAPAVVIQEYIATSEGDLTLTGRVPALGQDFVATPAATTLSLAGRNVFTAIPGEEGAFLIPPGFLRLYSRRGLWLQGVTPTVVVSTAAKSPAAADLTLAGKQPTLSYSWTATPAASELTLTGQTPFLQEFIAQPGAEALALAGQAPKAKHGPPITVPITVLELSLQGYVTTRAYGLLLTGFVPYLETEGVRSSSPAELSLTTFTPTIVNTTVPPIEIPVPEGQALSLLGYWPAQGIINPNQEATFILEGREPLSWTTSPTFFPGAYTLTLNAKQIISDVEGLAPEALLFLRGKAPSLASRTLIPGTGSLSLESVSPEVIAEKNYVPAVSLSLAGATASLRLAVSPGAGTVTLTGQDLAVTEGTNWKVLPAAGSLALSGEAPVVNVGPLRQVTAATTTLTGTEPILGQTVSVDLRTVELSLTGKAPELSVNLPVPTKKGALTINEQTFKMKLKRVRKTGARTKLISLTTEYDIESLYR